MGTIMKTLATAMMMLSAGMTNAALAAEPGTWSGKIGWHSLQSKSSNSNGITASDATGVTFDAIYTFSPQWSLDILAALPFAHDIKLKGAGIVGEAKQLPPTVSAQYHFNPQGRVNPYIGAGVNYTVFFNEKTRGALAGKELDLKSSMGPAAQLGVDIEVAPRLFLNVDARWMSISTEARLDTASQGNVDINPYALGISLGYSF